MHFYQVMHICRSTTTFQSNAETNPRSHEVILY